MQEPTTLFPVLLLPGSTRMDKELDQNKKVLEANLLKLLDPGQYYNPHLVKQLNEAGITVPDRNILSQLTDKSKLRDNGCIEYLRSKQQRQRKPTETTTNCTPTPITTSSFMMTMWTIEWGLTMTGKLRRWTRCC